VFGGTVGCEYHYKVSRLQFVCPVITAICFWNMDTIESWYSETGFLSYNEPKANTQHHPVWICYERGSRHPLTTAVHKWSYKSEETFSLFCGHIRLMNQADFAHQALHLSVTSRQGSGQFDTRRRQPGRPRRCWVEQVTTSTGLSPSDAWSVATDWSAWRALRPVDGQA